MRARLPGIEKELSTQVVHFIHAVRQLDLSKPPGVAETLDFVQAVTSLNNDHLDADVIDRTIVCVAKSVSVASLAWAAAKGAFHRES